jgi:hypothetical protein
VSHFIRVFIKGMEGQYCDVPIAEGDTFLNRIAGARLEGAICGQSVYIPFDNILFAAEITSSPSKPSGPLGMQ